MVGTHQDFYADMLDDRTGLAPSTVTQCASAEDAATSYFRSVFENSDGLVRAAVVAVWPLSKYQVSHEVFDMMATMTPSLGRDAEPGEFDVIITATPRA